MNMCTMLEDQQLATTKKKRSLIEKEIITKNN